ncbi:MAG TPA: iron-containing redox enzyme family protein [Kofleriaceae bacterium]|nr:iron-containing redox enzyme family protein [Kofleriaceae bacterium]
MSHKVIPPTPEAERILTDYRIARECLSQFGRGEIFQDTDTWTISDNAYRRPLRPHVLHHLDFSKPATRDELLNYSSLAANRALLTMYEGDFVFLPDHGLDGKLDDQRSFYDDGRAVMAAIARPWLERYLFSFLDREVTISGHWTPATVLEYFTAFAEQAARRSGNPATDAVLASRNREHAARVFLIQLANDFLVESSAMARNLPGNYGALQSALFKIVIDEYGYGVHGSKHSTLYEQLMRSVGLDPTAHAHWQFYLTSTLLLNNYYNHICRDHRKLFRYVGAIFYAETTFIHTCRDYAEMMRQVFGRDADVAYFLEHVHIDHHHSRMVLNELVVPVLERFGAVAVHDLVRGFEEARVLAELADRDFVAQVAWADGELQFKSLADPIGARVRAGTLKPPVQRFIEPRGELSVTHVHDQDELCLIVSGVMRFVNGFERGVLLHPGEGTVIQRQRLHGAIIESEECVYDIHTIGDHTRCLS